MTALLESGMTPEDILKSLLGDMGLQILDRMPARFHCNCSKERVRKAVVSVGRKELENMIAEGKPIEVNCHFCKYKLRICCGRAARNSDRVRSLSRNAGRYLSGIPFIRGGMPGESHSIHAKQKGGCHTTISFLLIS